MNLERNAVQALPDAVEKQSGGIGRQVENALATPLHDIQQAASQVRQNVKDSKWLLVASVCFAGVLIGLLTGYYLVVRTQNAMGDRLDRIEQSLAAPAQPTPVAPDPHVPVHKGKGK